MFLLSYSISYHIISRLPESYHTYLDISRIFKYFAIFFVIKRIREAVKDELIKLGKNRISKGGERKKWKKRE